MIHCTVYFLHLFFIVFNVVSFQTAIVCSLLPEIEDGGISYSPAPGDDDTTVGVGNVATYSCNRGYRLVGLEMRTCVGAGIIGQFSLIEPFCERESVFDQDMHG